MIAFLLAHIAIIAAAGWLGWKLASYAPAER